MKLTTTEKAKIEEFFCDVKLSKLFFELYETVSDFRKSVKFQCRDRIIGYGCPGEHLSAYITRNDKKFWIKFKTYNERIPFIAENKNDIKENSLMNEMRFIANKFQYQLTEKETSNSNGYDSIKSREKSDIVLSKLSNRKGAKKFTAKEFNALADWEYCRSFNENGYIYTLPNGNTIECDSKSELAILDYLLSKNAVLEIGGQELCIPYDTAFRDSVNYYPDLVILTKDYHIAIIEVKPVKAMSHHTNIEKYKALQQYCEEHGYEYMMVDPEHDYMTYDDLVNLQIPRKIVERVDDYLVDYFGTRKCLLEKSDIPVLYEDFAEEYKKGEFELYLHALVVQRGWYNRFRHGFEVYEIPKRA